jgi:MYXO-CTERM domain-containing protein
MKEALHRAGLRTLLTTSALAILIGNGLARNVNANPVTSQAVYYDTWGTVGTGSGPITFNGEGSSATPGGMSFISPGSFLLGQFQISSLPSSATLTYNDTPFQVFAQFSNTAGGPFSTVEIDGTLSGTITGNSTSSMFASVTSIHTEAGSIPPPFSLSDLSINLPQAIAPNGVNGGLTSLTALLSVAADPPAPVPEPGSMAVFVAVLGGFGAWRYRRRSR